MRAWTTLSVCTGRSRCVAARFQLAAAILFSGKLKTCRHDERTSLPFELGAENARMAGEVEDRRPQLEFRECRQLVAGRLFLGGADLDDQVSARQQAGTAFGDQ